MDPATLQLKIRAKLADGFLPKEFLLRVFGRSSSGQVCDACERIIPAEELEIEGNLAKGGHRAASRQMLHDLAEGA